MSTQPNAVTRSGRTGVNLLVISPALFVTKFLNEPSLDVNYAASMKRRRRWRLITLFLETAEVQTISATCSHFATLAML